MMKKINWPVLSSLLFLVILYSFDLNTAQSAFYKYIDRNGTIHFTDSYEFIPLEYRNQIKRLNEEKESEALQPIENEENNGSSANRVGDF